MKKELFVFPLKITLLKN